MNKTGIVVDAYSTGQNLPDAFARLGIDLVHVQSMKHILEYDKASFKPLNFITNIIFDNNLDKLIQEVLVYKPDFILAGCESGIVLADALAHKLGLQGNDPQMSLARRDKGLMHEVLRAKGVSIPCSIVFSKLEEAKAFDKKVPHWPKIVKPIDSAGSEGVYKCNSFNEVKSAYGNLFGSVNSMGSKNKSLILQEYLEGKQYFVNTVSWDGQHHVTDIWYDKKNLRDYEGVVCDKRLLLRCDNTLAKTLKAYAFECLDGLGVKFGPGHTEIIMTKRGPRLVETTSRLQGTVNPKIVSYCTGQNQVSVTALAYWDCNAFLKLNSNNYNLKQNAMVVYLISDHDFFLQEESKYEFLYNLDTYFSSINIPKNGDFIKKTIDLGTTPGIVYLVDKSLSKLEDDYAKLRAWEQVNINKNTSHFQCLDEYVL